MSKNKTPEHELKFNTTPKPQVSIAPLGKYSLFGRIKTHLWNFILPPQIRLYNKEKGSDD